MNVYLSKEAVNNSVVLAAQFTHNGKGYNYKSIDLDKLRKKNIIKPNEWNKIKMDYLTPEVRSTKDILVIHIWNRSNTTIYIDDISIEVFEPIPK